MRFIRRLLWRNLRKAEKGQALAEYQVLFPGAILLAGFMLPILAVGLEQVYCNVADALKPGVCESAQAPAEQTLDAEDEEQEECQVTLQEERGGSQCDQSADCNLLPGSNEATYTASREIESFVLKAGQEYRLYESGETNDGCYQVDISGDTVQWTKIGGGPNCKDVSHAQSWYVAVCDAEGNRSSYSSDTDSDDDQDSEEQDADHEGDHEGDHDCDHDGEHDGEHDCDHNCDHEGHQEGDHDCDHDGEHDGEHHGEHDS